MKSIVLHIISTFCLALIPNKKFDITFLNLARASDRRRHMIRILNYAKCRYKLQTSVDGNLVMSGKKNISDYYSDINLKRMFKRHQGLEKRHYGSVGLKLTHFILLQKMKFSRTNKPMLVLEDDVDIEADFVYHIENLLAKNKEYWDIILLTPHFTKDYSRPQNIRTNLQGIHQFVGTYGFLINGHNSARKLARVLQESKPEMPVDVLYGQLSRNMNIIGYALSKELVTHLGNIFVSSIDTSWYVAPNELNNSLYQLTKNIMK